MPQIIIDGKIIEAAAGKTIIEAALDNGITIPHFCWHPALSVAGNCRMCLVNVGSHKKDTDGALLYDDHGKPVVAWIPKMQIACATPVADGMIVDTSGEKAVAAQEAVMEFLLINHPLDCPICDEAGQCKLQEYAFVHSRGHSRFDEEKVHKPKRVQLGPNIMFDGERCISCSRCIRFAEEVAEQPVLTFVRRGDKVSIETFPGTTFDSPMSMNVIDICPVGALTSIDFRFRARVWEMSFTDSISPMSPSGTNIKLGVMNNQVLRVEPRTNMQVNTYWMRDDERLAIPDLVNEQRTNGPMVRRSGMLAAVSWDEAMAATAKALTGVRGQDVVVLGSAHASNEDNYALVRFARDVVRTPHLDLLADAQAPNATGARAVGVQPASGGHAVADLADRVRKGAVKVLIVLEDTLDRHSPALADAAASVETLIVLSSRATVTAQQATILLPVASFAEMDGTFTNDRQRVQRFQAAIATKENERYMGMKMSRWDKFGSHNDRWSNGLRRDNRRAWRILRDLAALLGTTSWTYTSGSDVFDDLVQHVPAFRHMSWELLDAYQGIVLGHGDKPQDVGVVYESHVLKPQ